MCLVVIAWQQHPDYPLVLAGNRDEFHDRPALGADWWQDTPGIAGGRDLQAGGSWLAIHRNGRFATVTNVRGATGQTEFPASRGQLVTDFLTSTARPLDYLMDITGERFAGFNLIVGDHNQLAYVSNRGPEPQLLSSGVYGLSNALLDSDWHKVRYAKSAMRRLISSDQISANACVNLLGNREHGPTDDDSHVHLDPEIATALSAPFIVLPDYGTRCSTALIRDSLGSTQLLEQRFDAAGNEAGHSSLEMQTETVNTHRVP